MDDSASHYGMEEPMCFPRPIYYWSTFLLCGCVLGVLCVVGLLGNVYAVIGLIDRYMAFSAFRLYLNALCFTDSCILFSAIFLMVIPALTDYMTTDGDVLTVVNQFIVLFYPLGMAAQTASAWLVVLMSALRFLAIHINGFQAFNTSILRAKIVVGSTVMLAVLFNVPRAFELKLAPCILTENNQTTYAVRMTRLRESRSYHLLYYAGAYGALICIAPILLLIAGHSLIVCYMIPHAHQYPAAGVAKVRNNTVRLQIISMLLACVAAVYLLCNIIPMITNIFEFYASYDLKTYQAYSILTDVGNFTVCLQASGNYAIYLVFIRKLRNVKVLSYASTKRPMANSHQLAATEPRDYLAVDEDGRYLRVPRALSWKPRSCTNNELDDSM